jgi:putative transposase
MVGAAATRPPGEPPRRQPRDLQPSTRAKIHRYRAPTKNPVLQRPDESGQYTSFAFTSRLIDAGVDASVGSVGDGYDNALAETTIGLYKTEKIHREGPWRTLADIELATLEWVDWYNHERLHSAAGNAPPVEFEALYLNQTERQQTQ